MQEKGSPLNSLFCGITAGAASQLCFQPVDVVRVRLQASGRGSFAGIKSVGFQQVYQITNNILKNEGLVGFFAGAKPGMVGAGLSWGLYFAVYNKMKKMFMSKGNDSLSTFQLLASSSTAGLCTSIIMHPVWFIKTRIQLNAQNVSEYRYKGSFDVVKRVYQKEGTRGLFRGLPASMIMVSHGMVFFLLYDKLKYIYLKSTKKEYIDSTTAFFISSVAKVFANFFSHPFSLIKTRIQDQSNIYHKVKYRGVRDAVVQIARNEGYLSFYRGILPALARSVPSGAITMALFEMVSKLLHQFSNRNE